MDERMVLAEEQLLAKGSETEEFKNMIKEVEIKLGKDKAELSSNIGEVGNELEAAITELKTSIENAAKKTNGGLGQIQKMT